ncbi:hypothetical protein MP228_011099 [Amoeboaphelidium protococcarum]|nr:hypothetical protein MP228_011099 [Amoeboaphelidium protococcarum]
MWLLRMTLSSMDSESLISQLALHGCIVGQMIGQDLVIGYTKIIP